MSRATPGRPQLVPRPVVSYAVALREAGWSLLAIARQLSKAGVPTPAETYFRHPPDGSLVEGPLRPWSKNTVNNLFGRRCAITMRVSTGPGERAVDQFDWAADRDLAGVRLGGPGPGFQDAGRPSPWCRWRPDEAVPTNGGHVSTTIHRAL